MSNLVFFHLKAVGKKTRKMQSCRVPCVGEKIDTKGSGMLTVTNIHWSECCMIRNSEYGDFAELYPTVFAT